MGTRERIGFLAFVSAFLLAGCMGNDSSGPVGPSPAVSSTVPVSDAADVPVGTSVVATFTKDMKPETVTSTTFQLLADRGTAQTRGAESEAAVPGTVTYSGTDRSAIFDPTDDLEPLTRYTATVSKDVQDLDGNPLRSPYAWSFTTARDSAPAPEVVSTDPASGAAGVALDSLITATFSTVMNAASLNEGTFVLTTPAGSEVQGNVSYEGLTATFRPTAALAANNTYGARITTGAQAAEGGHLASDYRWDFTTTPAGQAYVVYDDGEIPADSDVYTWSGADWGGPPSTFDASFAGETPPEGAECFRTASGANWPGGTNYAGWGVFLVRQSEHTTDVSSADQLRFFVKTPADLKLEIQQGGTNGQKFALRLRDYGWDGRDVWQEIRIPASVFVSRGADLSHIFSPFMATVEQGGTTFFVAGVRWEG